MNCYLITLTVATFFLLTGSGAAQSSPDIFSRIESDNPSHGNVSISQDSKITELVNLHLAQQKKTGLRGYRILIYMGSGQEANKDADAERAKFISKYEDVKSYKKWEYPFFKVYVGDFRTKSEALKFSKLIENDYPNSFIREDYISFPQ